MKEEINQVDHFHEVFRCYRNTQPTGRIPAGEVAVRVKLFQEELDEYQAAAEAGDITGVADALTDMLYVLLGTYVAHGMQNIAEELFAEVHQSNMSKLDENGQPIFREDGKVLKSTRFVEPDLTQILESCTVFPSRL